MKNFIIAALLLVSQIVVAKQLNVAFLGPNVGENAYWDNVITPMPWAAKQLDLKLSLYHADFNDRFDYYPKLKSLLESSNKPDFLISSFRGASAKRMLELIEFHKVPFISIVTDIPPSENEDVGLPQEHYKYWLAKITADDFDSGYSLANSLVRHARKTSGKSNVTVMGVGGDIVLASSKMRDRGLLTYIEQDKQSNLLQLVHSDWNIAISKRMVKQLMSRYKTSDVLWAANDDIALAAYESLVSEKTPESLMPVIGGVDWTLDGLQAVLEGKLAFTLGGNNMHGVWALIILNDHAKGYELLKEEQNIITPFMVADKSNSAEIIEVLHKKNWQKVDFRKMSKSFNQNLHSYDFDLLKLLTE